MTQNLDGVKWYPFAVVEKYDRDQVDYAQRISEESGQLDGATLAALCTPYETVEAPGNLLTTAGLTRMTALLIGTHTGTMDSTRVRLGVGDSATAAVVGDTSLGTNQYYRVMDATYPQASAGVITLRSTYNDADANFAWACWGCDVGSPTVTSGASVNAPLINRKVSALGTKASGSWVLTVTITFS